MSLCSTTFHTFHNNNMADAQIYNMGLLQCHIHLRPSFVLKAVILMLNIIHLDMANNN